jgi:hypothetical protein
MDTTRPTISELLLDTIGANSPQPTPAAAVEALLGGQARPVGVLDRLQQWWRDDDVDDDAA